MNQLNFFASAAALLLAGALSNAAAAPILIDDFESYAAGTYIQAQGGLNWSRFGNATSDGIYSIANGSGGGRAASYQVNFNPGAGNVNGSVRYTFATAQDYSGVYSFSLDIAVDTVLPGTSVFAQIAGDGSTPTIIETLVGQAVTSSNYVTYVFQFTPDNLRVIQGTESVDDVLAHLKSITFRFNNTTGGKQTLMFDQLQANPQPIPEASSVVLLGIAGGALLGGYRARAGKRRLISGGSGAS